MSEVNQRIRDKLSKYTPPIGEICTEIVAFAKTMPEIAIKDHLDHLIRKAVKDAEQ